MENDFFTSNCNSWLQPANFEAAETSMIQNIFVNHWQAKLVSLAIGTIIWVILEIQINPAFMDQLLTGTLTP